MKGEKERVFPFRIDSLRYHPISGAPFILRAGKIVRNQVEIPVFEVIEPTPFKSTFVKSDTLRVGSMTEPSTSGNWE